MMRIAIFRALYLGDLLLAIPALRAVRGRYPDAEITLIGLPWAASFVQRFSHYIDRFVEFAGYPGIMEVQLDPQRTARFLEEQQAYGYDLVVQMHGSGTVSTPFALELGGRVTVGYYEGDVNSASRRHDGSTRQRLLLAPYPKDQPEVLRNLGLARLMGCPDLGLQLDFPLTERDRSEAAELLGGPCGGASGIGSGARPPVERPWIGMHPGAKSPARRWPAEYFALAADELSCRLGARIILTGGPDEVQVVEAVADRIATQPVNLAGKTSLGGLAAVIDELDLFIGNDTGPAHLAQALHTPSVIIFGPADPVRWAPLDAACHRLVRHPVECSPCEYVVCPIDHRCLRLIPPSRIVDMAEQLLFRGAVA